MLVLVRDVCMYVLHNYYKYVTSIFIFVTINMKQDMYVCVTNVSMCECYFLMEGCSLILYVHSTKSKVYNDTGLKQIAYFIIS